MKPCALPGQIEGQAGCEMKRERVGAGVMIFKTRG